MTLSIFANYFGNGLLLLFLLGIPLYGAYRKVPVYDAFVEGAKDGFPTFLRIFPYVLAMLVAIGMLRASGAFDLLSHWLTPWCGKLGIPADVVPLAVIRPFSASGAIAVLADLVHTHGGNAMISHVAAVVASSADTTFYIAVIYFGAVAIKNTRYALSLSLWVDVVGMLTAIWVSMWLLK